MKFTNIVATFVVIPFVLASTCGTAAAQAKGKYTPKVYSDNLPLHYPLTLQNGITITEKNGGVTTMYQPVPIIEKAKKILFNALRDFPGNSYHWSFTITVNGDSFFSCESPQGTAGVSIVLLGIHSNGHVFLKKQFGGISAASRFIAANEWEVAMERQNTDVNLQTQPESALHSGIYDVMNYTLTSSGRPVLNHKSTIKAPQGLNW